MHPKMKLFTVEFRRIWKFSACEFKKKSCGCIFPIYASKNCREVQTHFGSSPLASLTEKVLGTISQILRPKTKLFAVKFRHISKVLCLQGLQKKFWA